MNFIQSLMKVFGFRICKHATCLEKHHKKWKFISDLINFINPNMFMLSIFFKRVQVKTCKWSQDNLQTDGQSKNTWKFYVIMIVQNENQYK